MERTRSHDTLPVRQIYGPQSSRLFQIAIQATADAARAESLQDSPTKLRETKKPAGSGQRPRSVHLTAEQWQLLTDYHEHDVFVRTRSWGFCLAIFGVGVTLFGLGSPAWMWMGDMKQPHELGIWAFCFANGTCFSLIYYLQDDWKVHTTIICLLASACIFGLLGLGLAITGACRSALILRLYYYHSAGECFLVSSAAILGALILYPISAECCIRNLTNHKFFPRSPDAKQLITHRFAYNYYLSWVASLFFATSFVCMNLDLIIQSCVRPRHVISNLINIFHTLCPNTRSRRRNSTRSARSAITPRRSHPRKVATLEPPIDSAGQNIEDDFPQDREYSTVDEKSSYDCWPSDVAHGDDGDWI